MAPKSNKQNFADYHTESPVWQQVDEDLKERIGKLRKNAKNAERAREMAEVLRKEFPDAGCALHHETPLQLLVATILSAQCTDERVNRVTPALFAKYPAALDFANSPEGELETDIHSTGFYNNKAKAIRAACTDIHERFQDKVPEAMGDLLSLRGVARKTANVIRTNTFGFPGLTVDTHFKRIANRLGLTSQADPEKIEAEIANLLPPGQWSHFCHSVILHGRKTCKARKPVCSECALQTLCPSAFQWEN